MGNSSSQGTTHGLTTEKCWKARQTIQASREKILVALREECDKCSDNIDLDEESHQHYGDSDGSNIDSTQYRFPFENLVLEGGGVKGLVYCGLGRALEEHGILKQMHRFAGTSIGSICAALYAVGFNSHDVEQIMSVNLETLVSDASYGYFSLIPNLLSHYGWHPGSRFLNYLGEVLSVKTNNPDITFSEVYKKFGNELCVVITNVNTMSEEYCHVKTTPDMPIRMAVRMSMSIPGVFQSVQEKLFGETNYYVDGGVICNYPIHCFDGWWLSLDHSDSFLQKIQPISKIESIMDRKNRFQVVPGPMKTIGSLIFSTNEAEVYKAEILKKSGVPMGKLPNTKLARQWIKTEQGKGKINKAYTEVCEAVTAFIEVLRKHNLDGNDVISKAEFENAFSEADFGDHYSKLLFGEGCSPHLAFDALDRDESGSITYNELINFIEGTGVSIHEKYLGLKRTEVNGFLSFLGTVFNALAINVMRIFIRSSDIDRSIGINSWYIKTNDFGLEEGDKKFLVDQGRRSTIKYLQHFVFDNNPEKVSKAVISARDVPRKPSLTDAQIARISKI
ncbi:unnamed protein product [Mytilus coruscus]|uniref:Uncharacterized protein n=1 Tax=Mytilus coruscus TaxID=42192 RepID=A0A6J8CEP0_MYTCO|nr:unnamed protein product [Mytilus coruscus]